MSTDEDLLVSSEVVNADWQFDVVRTYVLGVEILDARLSDAEFRLLTLLRLRAGGGRNNIVSQEMLAKDLGKEQTAIKRAMKNLRDAGYVTCERRGPGQSTKKTITSMSDRFDADILTMNRKQLLGSERTDELLGRLHGVDNTSQDPVGAKTPLLETIEENGLQKVQKRPHSEGENAPSEGANTPSKVNQVNVNHSEIDSPRSARCQPPTVSEDLTRSGREDPDAEAEVVVDHPNKDPEETRRDPRDADLDRANAAAAAALRNATDRSKVQMDKRRAKAEREELDGTKEERDKLKLMTQHERKTVGARFEEWARGEYDLFFPSHEGNLMARLDGKGFAAVKRLLELYEGDEKTVRRAWTYLCENWDEVRRKLKIEDTVPSIWLLYALRVRIFPMSQERKTNRQVTEHTTSRKKIGEW